MKIKKSIKKPGNAAIADRLKIDNGASTPVSGNVVGKRSSAWALVLGCAALVILCILTYTLYRHWEYLGRACNVA
ncbi:MAG: hypothetical protein J5807_00630 [Kiritimatiellae bacterium]|nr:hypothetical protein [Kiritimatiellia bacterium]